MPSYLYRKAEIKILIYVMKELDSKGLFNSVI